MVYCKNQNLCSNSFKRMFTGFLDYWYSSTVHACLNLCSAILLQFLPCLNFLFHSFYHFLATTPTITAIAATLPTLAILELKQSCHKTNVCLLQAHLPIVNIAVFLKLRLLTNFQEMYSF